jgi:hypothetical protein
MFTKISGHFVKKSGAKPALHRLNLQGAVPVIFKKVSLKLGNTF